MFLIHKHSVVQKWNPSENSYSELLACDVSEGDWIRGYDIFTQKYTRHKIVSKIAIMARVIQIKTSSFEKVTLTEDSYVASTSGIWTHRSSFKNVKLLKKNPAAGILTPKPMATRFGELDTFISFASSADTMLVDDYIFVTKDWNGLKIKSVGSAGATESVDAGQGTESSSGSGESGS